MPKELVALGVRQPVIREYQDEPLRPGHIRVRTQFGAPKHGTELHYYRGILPYADAQYDRQQNMFLPGPPPNQFPMGLGNMAVGVVTEIGPDVEGIAVGDRVASYGSLRETHTWGYAKTGRWALPRKMPEGMSWKAAVCTDPASQALGGVRDGNVRVGDRVAVFGLGAIGQMAVQLCKIAGALKVIAVDPIATRREVAESNGADIALDPVGKDIGLQIRQLTGGLGVDVSVETSGKPQALYHAVRGLAWLGRVAMIGWYPGDEDAPGADLGREANMNRPTFVFTRAESEPYQDHPRWNRLRQVESCWELLAAGRINCESVIQPVVPFEESVEAYREIDQHPDRSIKLGVSFGR